MTSRYSNRSLDPKALLHREGVRRFESVRGLCKSAANQGFRVCVQSVPGRLRARMEPFMSFRVENALMLWLFEAS
jgi:hypothetical protein